MNLKSEIIAQIARRVVSDGQVLKIDQLFKDNGGKWTEVIKANKESVEKLKDITRAVLSNE